MEAKLRNFTFSEEKMSATFVTLCDFYSKWLSVVFSTLMCSC